MRTAVLLIGAGGAARAITAGFAKEKARKITIANRTLQNANALAQFAHKIGIDANAVTLDQVGETASDYNFIVNATSIGMKGEPSPISTIIYGYEMLLGQAALAFKIWHGIEAPYETIKKSILGITF